MAFPDCKSIERSAIDFSVAVISNPNCGIVGHQFWSHQRELRRETFCLVRRSLSIF